jgi:type I restriction enzyme R subunit
MVSMVFIKNEKTAIKKDIFIQLIDYPKKDNNTYKIVNQLAIKGLRSIPWFDLYINGSPLVVFEFKQLFKKMLNS